MILVEFASKTPNQAIQIQLENLSKFCFYIFHQSINSWFSTDNIKGKCEMDYCNILFFVNISRFLFRQKLISSQVVTENCHSCPGEKQYLYCNLSVDSLWVAFQLDLALQFLQLAHLCYFVFPQDQITLPQDLEHLDINFQVDLQG